MLGNQTVKEMSATGTSTQRRKSINTEHGQRLERLKNLLVRASLYSQFLAENLSTRQDEQRNGSIEDISNSGSSNSSSRKVPFIRATRQPSLITGATMREHQLIGLEWLVSLYENGLSGILGDEMGLGKTLQCISFLAHLWEVGTQGPFLIVTPLSTLPNWMSELERFAPSIPAVMYHGDKKHREHLRKHKFKKGLVKGTFPIAVTTYEIAMNDSKYLQNIPWKFIIVDEGHRLKNLDCKLIRELKTYRSANRLLLTGTPLQNNLSELYSLLNFIMPDVFSDKSGFEELFSAAIEFTDASQADGEESSFKNEINATKVELVNQLHGILKPFLLRRVKKEVNLNLPPKREYIIYAPLTDLQKRLYYAASKEGSVGLRNEIINLLESTMGSNYLKERDIKIKELKENASKLAKKRKRRADYAEVSDESFFQSLEDEANDDEKSESEDDEYTITRREIFKVLNSQNLRNRAMQLRKICDHPYLFDLDYTEDFSDEEIDEIPTKKVKSNSGSYQLSLPRIVNVSGKMLLLERLLPKLFKDGHKVLIFSQMTKMLDIIALWCEKYKNWDYGRIDGNVSMDIRNEEIQKFNTEADVKLFLLSSRAGGLGINLTAADTVIIFDSDWNPQCDLQAQDRVHRMGQTKPCLVYRFATENTIEQRILDKAEKKRKLEKLVIHKELFKGTKEEYTESRTFDQEELIAALKDEETQFIKHEEDTSISKSAKFIGDISFNKKSFKDVTLDDYPIEIKGLNAEQLLESVFSESDVKRIMDRSESAYISSSSTISNPKNSKFRDFETPTFTL